MPLASEEKRRKSEIFREISEKVKILSDIQ